MNPTIPNILQALGLLGIVLTLLTLVLSHYWQLRSAATAAAELELQLNRVAAEQERALLARAVELQEQSRQHAATTAAAADRLAAGNELRAIFARRALEEEVAAVRELLRANTAISQRAVEVGVEARDQAKEAYTAANDVNVKLARISADTRDALGAGRLAGATGKIDQIAAVGQDTNRAVHTIQRAVAPPPDERS